MHIIRKSVFDTKYVESGNWGGQKMWKVEIGGSKNVECGNWGVLIHPPPPPIYKLMDGQHYGGVLGSSCIAF